MTPPKPAAKKAVAVDDSVKIKNRLKSLNAGFGKGSKAEIANNANDWMTENAKLNALRAKTGKK